MILCHSHILEMFVVGLVVRINKHTFVQRSMKTIAIMLGGLWTVCLYNSQINLKIWFWCNKFSTQDFATFCFLTCAYVFPCDSWKSSVLWNFISSLVVCIFSEQSQSRLQYVLSNELAFVYFQTTNFILHKIFSGYLLHIAYLDAAKRILDVKYLQHDKLDEIVHDLQNYVVKVGELIAYLRLGKVSKKLCRYSTELDFNTPTRKWEYVLSILLSTENFLTEADKEMEQFANLTTDLTFNVNNICCPKATSEWEIEENTTENMKRKRKNRKGNTNRRKRVGRKGKKRCKGSKTEGKKCRRKRNNRRSNRRNWSSQIGILNSCFTLP